MRLTTALTVVSIALLGAACGSVTRSLVRVIRTGGAPRRIASTPAGNLGIVANEGGWVDFIR
jgi:hypothetical protein